MLRQLLYMLIGATLVGALAFWLWNKLVRQRFQLDAAAQPATAAPILPAPSAQPIGLVLPRGAEWHPLVWGAVLLLGALLLFSDPEVLGSRWLAYPAGVVLLIVGPILMAVGWPVPDGRLIIDPQGLERQDKIGVARLAWSTVSAVQIETRFYSDVYRSASSRRSVSLVVLDAQGQTFLREAVPLKPLLEYQRLLASLPAWSGRPLAHTQVSNKK